MCRCAAVCIRILAGDARVDIETFRFLVVLDHEHVPVRLRQEFTQFGARIMMVQCIMFNFVFVSKGQAEEERDDEAELDSGSLRDVRDDGQNDHRPGRYHVEF